MDNTVKKFDNEVAAASEHIFSDEMIAKILETEEYMEAHPDEWVSIDELKARLAEV